VLRHPRKICGLKTQEESAHVSHSRRHYLRPTLLLAGLLVLPIAITPVLAVQDSVARWNTLAVSATITAGEGAVPQSRTLAVVQVAVHDALNAIDRRYKPYAFTGIAEDDASPDAAGGDRRA
jgi:hypothetical protein